MNTSNKELYVFAVIAIIAFVGVLFFSRKKDIYTTSNNTINGSYNTTNNTTNKTNTVTTNISDILSGLGLQ